MVIAKIGVEIGIGVAREPSPQWQAQGHSYKAPEAASNDDSTRNAE